MSSSSQISLSRTMGYRRGGRMRLTLLLLWRRAWRENAAFTSFMAFCVLRSSLLLYANFALKGSSAYFFLRLGAYPVQFVLLIAVVFEVVQIIFRPYEALPRGTLGNFALATLTVAIFSVMFTVRFPGTQQSEWIMLFRAVDQGFSWALWGIFAILTLFSSCLGIPWNHRVYGIVVGFFFYLSVDVAVVTMTAQFGLATAAATSGRSICCRLWSPVLSGRTALRTQRCLARCRRWRRSAGFRRCSASM